ncbi:hypothetical protein HYV80_00340 [Candidatus Woesearchaeota archaeon]|nr:hypothetical protein [Candidatus Woesearchaeota archaeon]
MLKKSQSISINTIIIAAIALAVLVVLFVIFTGRFKIFSEDVDKTNVNCNDACVIGAYQSGSDSSGSCAGIKISIKGKECCCQPRQQ